jgi:hypothetical protein
VLEWLGQLDEVDRSRVIREAFSKVASTESGAIALAVIFEQLYFFRRAETEEQQALNNYAKFLLTFMGEEVQAKMIESMIISARNTHIEFKSEGEGNGN